MKTKYNMGKTLENTISHLNDVLHLIEMRDALQARIDTYTVENLSYDLHDHRIDCEVLTYLNKRINDKKRIKTNYQYA
jgi:hypothetical protein